MARKLAVLVVAVTTAFTAVAGPVSAQSPSLSIREAKALAAKRAEKVKNDLRTEGATRAKVPGCWRNNSRQVSCYFSVYGYDAEQDFKWQCMLRIVVKLRDNPAPGKRYHVKYGQAVCG